MAMRPRSRFGNQPFRPPLRQANENFSPRSEWKYENDVTLLLVYLPGFVREQIRVMFTYDDKSSIAVRVQGQRSIGIGRRHQFNEVYKIPDTCEASKISTQFDRGVLTIVMPKLIVPKQTDQLGQLAEPKPTSRETTPSRQRTAGDKESTPQTSEAAEMEKTREEKNLVAAASSQKGTSEEKSLKGEDKTSPKAPAEKPGEEKKDEAKTTQGWTSSEDEPPPKAPAEKPREEKKDEAKTTQGWTSSEDEPSPKAPEWTSSEDETYRKEMEKQREERKDGALTTEKSTSEEKSQKREDQTSPKGMEKLTREEKKDGAVTTEKTTSEEKSQKGKDESASSKAASWDDDNQKQNDDEKGVKSTEAMEKAADETEKPKNKNVEEKAEVQSKESAAISDPAVTSRTGEIKHQDDDEKGVEVKPLLVNMGVALLVALGLGAYITYKITSSF